MLAETHANNVYKRREVNRKSAYIIDLKKKFLRDKEDKSLLQKNTVRE